MTELSKQLKEALALRGRTTDVRQQFGLSGTFSGEITGGDTDPADMGSVPNLGPLERIKALWLDDYEGSYPPRELYAGRWMMHFPKHEYPSSATYKGMVPMRLVGHASIPDSTFREIVSVMHKEMFDRFAAAQAKEGAARPGTYTTRFLTDIFPTLLVKDEFGIDAKEFIEGGELEQIFSAAFPNGYDMLKKIVAYIEDVYQHPLAPRQLRLSTSDRVYTLSQIIEELRIFHRRLVEPGRRNQTQGDILNTLSWPFGTIGMEP